MWPLSVGNTQWTMHEKFREKFLRRKITKQKIWRLEGRRLTKNNIRPKNWLSPRVRSICFSSRTVSDGDSLRGRCLCWTSWPPCLDWSGRSRPGERATSARPPTKWKTTSEAGWGTLWTTTADGRGGPGNSWCLFVHLCINFTIIISRYILIRLRVLSAETSSAQLTVDRVRERQLWADDDLTISPLLSSTCRHIVVLQNKNISSIS